MKMDYTMAFIDYLYNHGARGRELAAYADAADMALYGCSVPGDTTWGTFMQ